MGDLADKVTAALAADSGSAASSPKPAAKCPYAEPKALIKYGSTGSGVKWVQWYLNKAAGEKLAVDGLSRSVVRLPYDYTVVYSSVLCDVTKTQSGSVKYTLLDGSFSVLRTDTLDISSWNNHIYMLTNVLNQYKPIYVMLETISNTDLIVCTITTY